MLSWSKPGFLPARASFQGSQLTCAATPEARPSLSVYSTTGRFFRAIPVILPPDPPKLSLKLGNVKVWKRAYQPSTTTWTNCKHQPGIIKYQINARPYPMGTLKPLHRLKESSHKFCFFFHFLSPVQNQRFSCRVMEVVMLFFIS